jgi:MSHA biogenesis protein MshL
MHNFNKSYTRLFLLGTFFVLTAGLFVFAEEDYDTGHYRSVHRLDSTEYSAEMSEHDPGYLPQEPAPLPETGQSGPLISAPLTPGTPVADEDIDISGEKISLDLKGVDVVELFRILSVKTGLTIVPSRGVTGRINIFLNNLTFEEALDIILVSQGLACERTDNIIHIMTAAEYERLFGKTYVEKREYRSLKLNHARPATIFSALGQLKSTIGKIIVDEATGVVFLIDIPERLDLMESTVKKMDQSLQTEVIDLKYARPQDIKTHLSAAITAGSGELYVDERSSKVIVSDLPDKMHKVRRMIREFDESMQQVFIEAEILQVTLKDEYQQGINWERIFSEHLRDLALISKFPAPDPLGLLAKSHLKVKVGTLSRDQYSATMELLSTFGDTKILSRPRIAALNNEEARILVGERQAYVTQTLSQAETTTVTSENIEFIDVGVKINVLPVINKDGFVIMKIRPEVSTVKEILTTALGSTIPIIETSEAETTIKVKDGTMIMIAGLMKEDMRKDRSGVPFLSAIPILGNAFGSRREENKKSELIIFITPHIITGEALMPGTEPEHRIPHTVITQDMISDVVLRKLQEIKVQEESSYPDTVRWPQKDPEVEIKRRTKPLMAH